MYSTSDFKKNLKIEIDGVPYVILEANHVKPGKGNAFVKTTYRSMIDGRVLSKNFRSGDKVGIPNLESRAMQYLYKDELHYVFMDTNTYEQIRLEEEAIEEISDFLKDELEVAEDEVTRRQMHQIYVHMHAGMRGYLRGWYRGWHLF